MPASSTSTLYHLHDVPREPYKNQEIIEELSARLGDHPLPPEPIKLTSTDNVIYTVRLTSEQSKVVLWLFAHPSLHLDRITVDDGWTRTNKRARVVIDSLVGVKVDKRWVHELMEYWEDLPKSMKQALRDRYAALVEPKDSGPSAEGDVADLPSGRKRRRADESALELSLDGSSHDDAQKPVTTTTIEYIKLNTLFSDICTGADTISTAFREYKDVAFSLQARQQTYETQELSFLRLQEEREAVKREKDDWEHTRETERKMMDDEHQLRLGQLDARAAQLEAEYKQKLEVVALRSIKAENDLAEARKEREFAEVAEHRVGVYILKSWRHQPSLLLQAVRELKATARDEKLEEVWHQLSALFVSPDAAADGTKSSLSSSKNGGTSSSSPTTGV